MHKWERGNLNWKNYTHLDPAANMLHENFRQSLRLKKGRTVFRRHYDHNTGDFTLPIFIRPKKLIIFEGLHSFFLQNQADVYDLKIFMSPDEELRKFWKIQRDVKNRGYTEEKVISQLESRLGDSIKFIHSQSSLADINFGFYFINNKQADNYKVGLSVTMDNNIFIEPVIESLEKCEDIYVNQEYDGNKRILKFEGTIKSEIIDRIGTELLTELEEVGIYEPEWESDLFGIMQLVTVYVIFKRLENDES